jgi:hypothetical protein
MYLQKHSPTDIIKLSPQEKDRRRTPYTYLVSEGALGHTAFKTEKGLNYWLNMTGLKAEPLEHDNRCYKITGSYLTKSVETLPRLDSGTILPPNSIGWWYLFNGEYRPAIVNYVDDQHVITFEWTGYITPDIAAWQASPERLQKHIYLDALIG